MGYLSLIDISVDTDTLRAELDMRPTEDRVQELVAAKVDEYISDESLMSHSAVVDTIEEHIKDNLDISGEVESALDGYSYQTESDVQAMIDSALEDHEGMTESEVQDLIDTAIADADNADVDALENQVKDLERRFDLYAHKVDTLTQDFNVHIAALEAKLDALGAESAKGLTLFDLLTQAARILGIAH